MVIQVTGAFCSGSAANRGGKENHCGRRMSGRQRRIAGGGGGGKNNYQPAASGLVKKPLSCTVHHIIRYFCECITGLSKFQFLFIHSPSPFYLCHDLCQLEHDDHVGYYLYLLHPWVFCCDVRQIDQGDPGLYHSFLTCFSRQSQFKNRVRDQPLLKSTW